MSGAIKLSIHFPNIAVQEVWTLKGKTIWEALNLTGIFSNSSCGGNGTCGKCKVRIPDFVNEISKEERELLLTEEINKSYRLACYCTLNDSLDVYFDYQADTLIGNPKLILNNHIGEYDSVNNRKIYIPGFDKNYPIPLYERICNALPDHSFELPIADIKELLYWDREGRPTIELNALVFADNVVKKVSRKECRAFGLAMDIGTTSLFMALVDLQTARIAEVLTKPNMQRVFGGDLVTRVDYCVNNDDGLEKLHRIVINNINNMIEEIISSAGIDSADIYRCTVVGNPVMLHILLNIGIINFASAPFTGVFRSALTLKPEEIGLNLNSGTIINILPQIGGFVGADTVSAMMVLPKPNEQNFVLIDIGTNGEIVVGNKGEFWSASAAAGPAFEGGGLQSGMHAGIGAIDKVSLTNDELIYSWLGNENTIRGICGSGALDLLACLFIGEFIAENGVFTSKARQLLKLEASANGGSQLVLFDESTNPYKIVFSQEDIRQIQLAKAALRTAIDLLLEKSKLKLEELDALYIAGSFGTFLNPSNALTIGLLPKINPQKIINIGNAAGLGAVNTLLSENLLRQSQLLASRIQHIDLAAQAEFQQSLIKNIDFYR